MRTFDPDLIDGDDKTKVDQIKEILQQNADKTPSDTKLSLLQPFKKGFAKFFS